MNFYLKSVLTLFVALATIALTIWLFLSIKKDVKASRTNKTVRTIIKSICCVIAGLSIIPLLLYSYPFDISVNFEQIDEVITEEDMQCIEGKEWSCDYHVEHFSLFAGNYTVDSYHGAPVAVDASGFDYSKYTYMFSFERKVEKLSYQVWNTKNSIGIIDFGTDTKWGTAKLSEERYEGKIFVYRFPKKAIDNKQNTKYAD